VRVNRQLLAKPDVWVRASGWPLASAAFAIAVMLLLACYWQTLQSLVGVWAHDGTYQYAFLIFPLSLWLAITLRDRVSEHSPVPSAWGLAALVVLVGIWYVGDLLDVSLARHFAFVVLFPALVLACWGWHALRILAFPLGYLVAFVVPWGDGLVGPLQDITARFAVEALNLTGIPVLLNGREIISPSAVWMVEAACSGVKFFMACAALGCLFAYLMYQRGWKRIAFVLVAAVVPIIANGLRVYFTVLIGEIFGMKYATGTDHMLFGWQFFGTVLALVLLAGWFFRDRPVPRQRASHTVDRVIGVRKVLWPVALALLAAGPALAATLVPAAAAQPHLQLVAPMLAGWVDPRPATASWQPFFKGADGQLHAIYKSTTGSGAIELFHAVYTGRPRAGHTLITFGNDVYDPAHARVLESATRQIDFVDGSQVRARELRLAAPDGTRLVWYWYCVDRRCSASPVVTKLLQAWDVVRGQTPRSVVWAVSSPVTQDDAGAIRMRMLAFATALPVTTGLDTHATRARGATGIEP
jgi:exosortase A